MSASSLTAATMHYHQQQEQRRERKGRLCAAGGRRLWRGASTSAALLLSLQGAMWVPCAEAFHAGGAVVWSPMGRGAATGRRGQAAGAAAFVGPRVASVTRSGVQRRAAAGAGSVQMISSMFRWRKNDGEEEAIVNIEAPTSNSRRISSSIVVNRPVADVWRILTDYDNLAEYVPNLTQSRVVPKGPADPPKGVRLFQEGAQKIIGFNFKASLTMDMEEVLEGEDEKLGQRRIKFKLVDSQMFNDFSGEWRLQCYSRIKTDCGEDDYTYSTKLFYMVTVKPKGPVPVAALEWRIKEDVPTNLRAVKVATEALPWDCTTSRAQPLLQQAATQWQQDETLQAYMPCPIPTAEQQQEEQASYPSSSSSSTLSASNLSATPSRLMGGSAGSSSVIKVGLGSSSRPTVNAAASFFNGRFTKQGEQSRGSNL